MTRRMTTLKWVFYALWTLVFLLVQQLMFPYLRIAGVHPFILPSLAAIAASFEGKREGPVYALVLGLVCDTLFTGAFPCFYAVVLTLSALLAGQAARHNEPPGEAMWLTAREILLSLPFAMLVHLVFSRVHRRFDRR